MYVCAFLCLCCLYAHLCHRAHMDIGEQLLELVLTFHAILRLVLVSAHFPGLPDLLVLELHVTLLSTSHLSMEVFALQMSTTTPSFL